MSPRSDAAITGITAGLSEDALRRIASRMSPAQPVAPAIDPNRFIITASSVSEATAVLTRNGFESEGSLLYRNSKQAHGLWQLEREAGGYALVRLAAEPSEFAEDAPVTAQEGPPGNGGEMALTASSGPRVGSLVEYPLGGELVKGKVLRVASVQGKTYADVKLASGVDEGVPTEMMRQAWGDPYGDIDDDDGIDCPECGTGIGKDFDGGYHCSKCDYGNESDPPDFDPEKDASMTSKKAKRMNCSDCDGEGTVEKDSYGDMTCRKCGACFGESEKDASRQAQGLGAGDPVLGAPAKSDPESHVTDDKAHMNMNPTAEKKLAAWHERYFSTYGAVLADEIIGRNLPVHTLAALKVMPAKSARKASTGVSGWAALATLAGQAKTRQAQSWTLQGVASRVASKTLNIPFAYAWELRGSLAALTTPKAKQLVAALRGDARAQAECNASMGKDAIHAASLAWTAAKEKESHEDPFEIEIEESSKKACVSCGGQVVRTATKKAECMDCGTSVRKTAVDQAAEDYWKAYYGEYGTEWVREIKRRIKADLIAAALHRQGVDEAAAKYYGDYYGKYGDQLTEEVDRKVKDKKDVTPEGKTAAGFGENLPSMNGTEVPCSSIKPGDKIWDSQKMRDFTVTGDPVQDGAKWRIPTDGGTTIVRGDTIDKQGKKAQFGDPVPSSPVPMPMKEEAQQASGMLCDDCGHEWQPEMGGEEPCPKCGSERVTQSQHLASMHTASRRVPTNGLPPLKPGRDIFAGVTHTLLDECAGDARVAMVATGAGFRILVKNGGAQKIMFRQHKDEALNAFSTAFQLHIGALEASL